MRARRRPGDAGVALVVTLLALVLIMALVWEIFHAGARAAQSGAYGRDSIRAALLAEAGAQAAKVILREDAKDNDFDSLNDIWSLAQPPYELGGGTIALAIEDEERKINLNNLMMPQGNAPNDQNVAVFRRLLEILAIDPSVADAVLDWLDNDESPRVGGAESSYYLSLPYPYKSKNDLFDTLGELRLVRGVTAEVFEKLRPYVTVHSTGRVNINTAPKEVLMALSAGQGETAMGEIDEKTADALIASRQDKPFRSAATLKADLAAVSPTLGNIYGTIFKSLIDVRSANFHVRATGDVAGTVRTIDSVGTRTGNVILWRYWRLE
ncbi:MAG: type II secretion system minor pseudopilin GspK [Gemmatimonadota bacterium]